MSEPIAYFADYDVSMNSPSLTYIKSRYPDVVGKQHKGIGQRRHKLIENDEIYNLSTENALRRTIRHYLYRLPLPVLLLAARGYIVKCW